MILDSLCSANLQEPHSSKTSLKDVFASFNLMIKVYVILGQVLCKQPGSHTALTKRMDQSTASKSCVKEMSFFKIGPGLATKHKETQTGAAHSTAEELSPTAPSIHQSGSTHSSHSTHQVPSQPPCVESIPAPARLPDFPGIP